jgi:hypothetical protein
VKLNNQKFHDFTPRQILLRRSKKEKRLTVPAVNVRKKRNSCWFLVGTPEGRELLESKGLSRK